MFEKRTVVIVGAGASAECDLPTGKKLKWEIAQLLDIKFPDGCRQSTGDRAICLALRMLASQTNPHAPDINPYLHEAWHIHDAMPQALSIDNFIDAHQGNEKLELCGKLAIVRAILDAEKKSRLYFNQLESQQAPDFSSVEDTWFAAFFRLLTENCRVEHIEERLSTLSLVVFNYDRCIEHFIYHSLKNYYRIPSEQAAQFMSRLVIFHPYGTVGALPWQGQPVSIEFGADPKPEQLVTLSGQIQTFTEGTDPLKSHVGEIRTKLLQARIVLFLGFAYHRQNLEFLRPDKQEHEHKYFVKYFGTAQGISDSDCAQIVDELSALAGAQSGKIVLRNDLTCSKLFAEYWRSLSLSRTG